MPRKKRRMTRTWEKRHKKANRFEFNSEAAIRYAKENHGIRIEFLRMLREQILSGRISKEEAARIASAHFRYALGELPISPNEAFNTKVRRMSEAKNLLLSYAEQLGFSQKVRDSLLIFLRTKTYLMLLNDKRAVMDKAPSTLFADIDKLHKGGLLTKKQAVELTGHFITQYLSKIRQRRLPARYVQTLRDAFSKVETELDPKSANIIRNQLYPKKPRSKNR